MGVKKKEAHITELAVCRRDLEALSVLADAEGRNLASHLLRCVQLSDAVSQIRQVKEIVPLLEKANKNGMCDPTIPSCLDVLAGIYLSLNQKNPLKKVLASSLSGLPACFLPEATESFASRLQEELRTADLRSYRNVMDNLASCLESLSLGRAGIGCLLPKVLQFLQRSLSEISEESRQCAGNRIVQTQLMNDLLAGVRVSMMLVQKVPDFQRAPLELPGSPVWQSMCALLTIFSAFLTDDELLQTIQSTCGLAVLLFIKVMLHPSEMIPDLVSRLLRGSGARAHAPEWLLSCCGSLCCAGAPSAARLFLCQGTLSMLDWQDARLGPGAEQLLLDTAQVLLTLSSEIKESTLEMFLSRILASWTNTAVQVLQSGSPSLKASLRGDSDTAGRLLEYVYTHWEHPVDALRHQSKVIFRNLLQMHRLSSGEGSLGTDDFLSELMQSLLQLEWHIRGKYTGLACLVTHMGVEPVLAAAPTIPSQILGVMGDQTLVPYASDLLETMFRSHRSHLRSQAGGCAWTEQWHETWVSPLLRILCEGSLEQRAYVIDYYLPKLLDCSPESLSYMVKVLQTSADPKAGSRENRGALGALMACLRAARAHGHLRSATETWQDVVSSTRIKQGLVHQHCQVRMDTLGLLCESNRSTEAVSLEEARCIQFFLAHSLHSQAPGVRQQTCALLKKLFLRVRESAQVLYRLEQSVPRHATDSGTAGECPSATLQRYKDFMSSVCDILFEALFPGSSYSTRFSALTLLGSITDVFPAAEGVARSVYQLSHDVDAGRVRTLVSCLSSTFEDVKLLAFDLVMKLPRGFVRLQDEDTLRGWFQAALELSTSTKPYDCVTASYLLALLIWQDALPPELCGDPQPACWVEGNTLHVIRFLLEALEEDIAQAERSLLRAAASCPLYGRVHCIRGVFQRLSPDSLQSAEWPGLARRLLSVSYRLSAVVAPVIQSSSPEGLVPMDTDAESASRLQRILSEIQPRDSNGFFAYAQVLREHSAFDMGDLCASVPSVHGAEEAAGSAYNVTAQMVLVCCWRSMKEVALLLGTLCQLLPLQAPRGPAVELLTEEQVREIGDYFKQHLLQSRHRGAFELAYTGFVKLTETLARCPEAHLQQLPEHWLRAVLAEVRSSDPSSKLCATRRSAGIPFYIQALLASEPKRGRSTLLKTTMRELLSLAVPAVEPSSTVPQVHALNILRALFRDTRLGEGIMPYVAEGMKAAVLGFTSPIWAVRNSSTLLFSTLITRIFGVKRERDELSKKNRMTGSEFFSRFPELYPFLLRQLETASSTVDSDTWEPNRHPSMFLLLLVLERLYPSPMEGSCSALSLAPFRPFITRCGHSPIYRLREMAARALVPFVSTEAVPATVRALLAKLPGPTDHVRQNHVHGMLLQALHLLRTFSDTKPCGGARCRQELATLLVDVKAKVWLAKRRNPCLVTRAVYLDILLLLTQCLDAPTSGLGPAQDLSGLWEDIYGILEDSELQAGVPTVWVEPGLPPYLQSLARLGLAAAYRAPARPVGSTLAPLALLLGSRFPEVRLQTLQTLGARLSAPHPSELGLAALGCDAAKELVRLAVREEDAQCLHQVLSVLLCLDPGQWLPLTHLCGHLTPEAILSWTLDIAIQERSAAQHVALRLASRVLALLPQPCEETLLDRWVQLVVTSCREDLPTESRLAAAASLGSTAHLLAGPCPVLGLQATLELWRSELALLQSEEQAVRDAASEAVTTVLSQETTQGLTEFAFCSLDASMALPLALTVLSGLLQQWGQLGAGLPILLGWVLAEDLKEHQEDEQQGDEDHLFDKDTVNLWAEPLLLVKHLSAQVAQLLASGPPPPCDPERLSALRGHAQTQQRLLSLRRGRLPPNAAFLRTSEFTQLCVAEERTRACLRLLTQLS